jgi:hypothetical protein
VRRAAEFLVQEVLLRVERSVPDRSAAAFVASPAKTPHRPLVAQRVPLELSALAAAVLAANSELLENSHPTDSAPAPNLRRPRAAARPSARTFRRRCRTCRWRRAFLSDGGGGRTCLLHKGNTRRLASLRLGDALHSRVLLRSTPVSACPMSHGQGDGTIRDWESADGNRNALLFRDRCDSPGLRCRSRSAQRLRLWPCM